MPVCLLSLSPADAGGSALKDRIAQGLGLGLKGLLLRGGAPLLADAPALPAGLAEVAAGAGLALVVEADVACLTLPHPLVEAHPGLFSIRRRSAGDRPIDPRRPFTIAGTARAKLGAAEASGLFLPRIAAAARALATAGAQGLLLSGGDGLARDAWQELVAAIRQAAPDLVLLAGQGGSAADLDGIVVTAEARDPDALGSYVPAAAPLIAEIAAGDHGPNFSVQLMSAAVASDALVVPAPLLDRGEAARAMIARAVRICEQAGRFAGETRMLTGAGAPVVAFVRGDRADMRQSAAAMLAVLNRGDVPLPLPDVAELGQFAGADFAPFLPLEGEEGWDGMLAAGEVRLFSAARATPIRIPAPIPLEAGAAGDRLVVEDIRPRVDGGDFAVKRIVGETVTVEATLFGDGHEQLAAELCWRALDEPDWQRVRMEQLENDQWRAAFPLPRLGRYEFQVEGWLDRFGGFRRDFTKKLQADVAQPVDHAEGRVLIEAALARAAGDVRDGLESALGKLAEATPDERGATLLLSPELAALMDAADDRPHRVRSPIQRVDAERTAARFSSWYELFPRSQSGSTQRHGTFADVIGRLPAIRDMGFDTLYFPPIHPIGLANRKGPNNTLTPGPNDPGSPYAIGSADGGHDAIHPQLGTFEDFRALIAAAAAHGLEIALDFAIQCSPDHPWLKEHPGWFAWRPDGSMKYAENPPKKYQDIVNVDFYAPDAIPGLWLALRDVILLWVGEGVKTFRVDNPHTKTLPFWEWMIADVRARHPEVIFLAEAFTRPAMMYRLAKIGFSQSYTYFTWRDGKQELTDYIVELTTTAPREFYRPHFFVNTPDINPIYLQTSGRPGFRIRAVLAATLSGLFGVYSGFELCEAAAMPGKEEYLDSEKYELRPRDWQAPGNIIADITLLNRLRRAHPALQTHLNTRFYRAGNDNIIWYGKPAPDGSHMVMVMVSLDPHNAQETDFDVPLWEFCLPDDGSVAVEDLAEGHRFRWYGKAQSIRLDPEQPYRIWRIAPGDHA